MTGDIKQFWGRTKNCLKKTIQEENKCFKYWFQILVNSHCPPTNYLFLAAYGSVNLLPFFLFSATSPIPFQHQPIDSHVSSSPVPHHTSQLQVLFLNIPTLTITIENHIAQEEWTLFFLCMTGLVNNIASTFGRKHTKITITKCCLATFEYMYVYINYWYINHPPVELTTLHGWTIILIELLTFKTSEKLLTHIWVTVWICRYYKI